MRMAGPDIVLFVVGALLFGGAAFAIANTPGGLSDASSPLGLFQVSWAGQETEVGSEDVASVRSASATFTVEATGVASVIVRVACADPAPGPAAFTVQVDVAGPNGLTGQGSGTCGGDIVVPVEVEPAPADTTVRGTTESEARAALPEPANATAAQGEWTVSVSGGRGGGALPVPVGDPSGTISLAVETYVARLTPVVG